MPSPMKRINCNARQPATHHPGLHRQRWPGECSRCKCRSTSRCVHPAPAPTPVPTKPTARRENSTRRPGVPTRQVSGGSGVGKARRDYRDRRDGQRGKICRRLTGDRPHKRFKAGQSRNAAAQPAQRATTCIATVAPLWHRPGEPPHRNAPPPANPAER